MAKQIWSIIEKNRWTVIMPLIGLLLWIYMGVSCTPTTESPLRQGEFINALQLQNDYEAWKANTDLVAKRFERAGKDIEFQQEQWNKVENALMTIASGNVTTWTGLLGLVTGSGIIGLAADNIRKNGVIGGLKRNKTPP